jgi:maltooligosyltrehalose trehalohydrolase
MHGSATSMAGSAASHESMSKVPVDPARRRLPVGADYLGDGLTHVRVWAPPARRISVVAASKDYALANEGNGYFSATITADPGVRYQFRVDDAEKLYPDPASRYQPEGPEGPSEIVDPAAFKWTDGAWPGVTLEGQVVYELHIGTFTREGTFAGATRELPELSRIGITIIEVMPVADFHGRFGWGYDGVNLFAPTRLYGQPDDFRRFVDAAHALGIGVILDVVYNHLGPVGNYLRAFSPAYFTDRYDTEWGAAINFDGPDAGPVREYFAANAGYWVDEFHLDGLRLDATDQIHDASGDHILMQIGRHARQAAGKRNIVLIAENESQETRLVRPIDEGGYGLDGLWNDDLHHSAIVAITGRAEAYYSDTRGEPQEFISAAKYGYLFQGQPYHWQRQPRGTPAWGLSPSAFITFLENHDQVANSARGMRVHQLTSPGRWRAMTALMLLMPGTPMLFQGQEFSASAPFLYFADWESDLADLVRKGRRKFLMQFPSMGEYGEKGSLDDPCDAATPARCVLDFSERRTHAGSYAMHQDLLALRRDAAFREGSRGKVDGAVLGPHAFALRFFTDDHLDDRLLIVNLGSDLTRPSFAEPLLAPPAPAFDWAVRWSSEAPAYGGRGTPSIWTRDAADSKVPNAKRAACYLFAGESAVVMRPCPRVETDDREAATSEPLNALG